MNFIGTTRTNYFGITDRPALDALLERTDAEDEIKVLEREYLPGKVALACHGCIFGLDDDLDDDGFTAELQKLLVPGDAIIMQEAGSEGLRYVSGTAVIVTKDDVKYLSLDEIAFDAACDMLGSDWSTVMDY